MVKSPRRELRRSTLEQIADDLRMEAVRRKELRDRDGFVIAKAHDDAAKAVRALAKAIK